MPTYDYACTVCDERIEVVQRFTDPPLTECPACGGALRKVFSPVGVVFKGSGFYKTDSRGKKSPTSSPAAAKPAEKSSDSPSTRPPATPPSSTGEAAAAS